MMQEPFIAPFTIIAMPLNEYGEGPETDPLKISETRWEIWDQLNRVVSSYNTLEEAQIYLDSMQLHMVGESE